MLHLPFQPFSPSPPATPTKAGMEFSGHEQGFVAEEEIEDGGNLFCEDFQVEDLLDLRALSEFEEDEEVLRVTETSFSPQKAKDKDSTSVECVSRSKAFVCAENNPLEFYLEISAQDTETASLEWLSHFFDEISKEFPSPPPPLQAQYLRTGVKAKRSKRTRGSGAVWSRSSSLKLSEFSPTSSITSLTAAASPTLSSSSSSSSTSASFNSYNYELFEKPKKRGRRPKSMLSQAERRCAHCGVHKTPQWRAGPQGPKTLCNACGVRFKSGRLLPEYRPACSPTFVGSIHSNSHRKVLEMRRKNDERILGTSC